MITVVYIGKVISNLVVVQIREENIINFIVLNPYESNLLGTIDRLGPDVVILFLDKPIDTIKQVKNSHSEIKIIVAVNNSNPVTYFELLKENVDYLLDNNAISAKILVDAILSVGQHSYFPIPSNQVKPFMKKLEDLKLDNYDIFIKRLVSLFLLLVLAFSLLDSLIIFLGFVAFLFVDFLLTKFLIYAQKLLNLPVAKERIV